MMQTPEPETAEPSDAPVVPSAVVETEAVAVSVSVTVSAETTSSDDASSAVDDVLAQVRERGFITTGEIFAAFPDLEPDAAELRDLWDMFEARGIKVLDE